MSYHTISFIRRLIPAVVAAVASVFIVYVGTETPVAPDSSGNSDGTETPVDPGSSGSSDGDDVTVPTAGKSVDSLLKDGHAALKKKSYDEALGYYEGAYKNDGNNAKAITYSVLAKLAGISIDPKVVSLIKNKIGFSNYPNRLNALLSTDWMKNYPSESFDWGYWDDNIGEYGEYVSWYDRYDVDNGDYPGINREGYYYSTHVGYVFVNDMPRYEDRIVWSYCDDLPGSCIRWFDEWEVQYGYYPGVNSTGYYSQNYNNDYGDWVYTFISNTPRYEQYIAGYYDNVINRYVRWFDEWEVEYGYVGRVGYYYDNYVYNFVSAAQRNLRVYDNYLPGLLTPDWVKGDNNSVYNTSLINNAPSLETWSILLFANLLDKNTNGLNSLLDETITAVFGGTFDEICTRTNKLKDKGSITLDREFLTALEFDGLIDEYDKVGWAELNALTSFMTGIKASLEWVAAYDWNTDLGFLKFAWGMNMEEDFYNKLKNINANNLPFNNSFLEARPDKMNAAKTDFVKAVTGLKASYSDILTSDLYPSEVKNAYPTLSQGADKLIAAINNGTVFYVPDDPTKGNWPTTGNGVHMGKLFEPGYFSLQNLFETETNRRPVFYAKNGTKLTISNYTALIDDAGYAALKFKAKHVTDVLAGYNTTAGDEMLDIPARYAKLLFEKYNNIPLSKARTAPLAKAKAGALAKSNAEVRIGK